MKVSGVVAAALANKLASLLLIIITAALVFAGLQWYWGRDDRQARADARAEALFKAAVDSVGARMAAHYDSARAADQHYQQATTTLQPIYRTIERMPAGEPVPRPLVDSLRRACTLIQATCEQRVHARDSIIADKDAIIDQWRKRFDDRPVIHDQGSRLQVDLAALVDVDRKSFAGQGVVRFRVRGPWGVFVSALADTSGVRRMVGVSYTFK